MRINDNKKVFSKPVVYKGEIKVVHVVCKKAACSGSSSNITISKFDKATKNKDS